MDEDVIDVIVSMSLRCYKDNYDIYEIYDLPIPTPKETQKGWGNMIARYDIDANAIAINKSLVYSVWIDMVVRTKQISGVLGRMVRLLLWDPTKNAATAVKIKTGGFGLQLNIEIEILTLSKLITSHPESKAEKRTCHCDVQSVRVFI